MKLKTTKRILWAILGLILVLIMAMVLTETPVLGYIGMGCLVPYIVILTVFWRCPACGKTLMRLDIKAKYCPYCGEEIFLE